MSGFAEYSDYDAVGLAALVRRKEIRPRELLEEAADRCARVNPRLNAVIYRMDAAAEKAAAAINPAQPLAGVPFLAKDIGPALAGAPHTSGSRLFANYVPEEDGEIVKRFKRAGLVIFGKTNVPEFGLLPVTEPELFGPCRNPWDTNRTPGGSSGGSAAAVAAGIVPMAHASDGGGSIRIPASCCGLVGLKPSRGLNPQLAQTSSVTGDFGVDHAVSRSVRDCAAALDAVCNRANAGFLSSLEAGPGRLRIGVVRSAMLGSTVSPEAKAGLYRAVKLLESLGHDVEDAEPEVDYGAFAMAFLVYWAVGAAQGLEDARKLIGREPARSDFEFATWSLVQVGRSLMGAGEADAKRVLWQVTKTFTSYFDKFDIMLSPVLATPPLKIGQNRITGAEELIVRFVNCVKQPWLMKAVLKGVAAKSFGFAAFTVPFNVTGQPAISLPLYWTPDGLPIGIQFAAKLGADGLLLRLARQLELAQGWEKRRPPVWAGEAVPEAV
ncbi:MAG: amidase [Rhodomicrobium sp.]